MSASALTQKMRGRVESRGWDSEPFSRSTEKSAVRDLISQEISDLENDVSDVEHDWWCPCPRCGGPEVEDNYLGMPPQSRIRGAQVALRAALERRRTR